MKFSIIKRQLQTCSKRYNNNDDDDFFYDTAEGNVFIYEYKNKIKELFVEEGACPSGWTTSNIGIHQKSEYKGGWQYIVDDDKVSFIDTSKNYGEDVFKILINGEEIISFSNDGDEDYYPEGYLYIFFDTIENIFKNSKNNRSKERIIYIVEGASDLGKSSLFHLTGLKILEVDSLEKGKQIIIINNYDIIIYNKNRNEIELDETDFAGRIINVNLKEMDINKSIKKEK